MMIYTITMTTNKTSIPTSKLSGVSTIFSFHSYDVPQFQLQNTSPDILNIRHKLIRTISIKNRGSPKIPGFLGLGYKFQGHFFLKL